MKNKKSLFILGPAVLLVWALIVYQVSEGLQVDNPYYTGAGTAVGKTVPAVADTFAYALGLQYPDPFLGKLTATPVQRTITPTQPQVQAKVQALQPVAEPQLELTRYKYIGIIEHKGKKDKLALLSINGQSVMLREGEVHQEIELLRIATDSVELQTSNKRFYIRR